MKKIVALLMLVCIALLPAAVAESVTWEEVGGAAVEAYGLEGDFVTFDEMGLSIWIPSDLSSVEPSEEDVANGRYALYIDNDQECYLAVDAINVEGMTLDQALENAVNNGMTEPEMVTINGLDAVTYADPNNNIGVIVLVDTNSNMIIFSFGPVDSDEGKIAYGVIASSLMPAA